MEVNNFQKLGTSIGFEKILDTSLGYKVANIPS